MKEQRGACIARAFSQVCNPDPVRLPLLQKMEFKSFVDIREQSTRDLHIVIRSDAYLDNLAAFFIDPDSSHQGFNEPFLKAVG